MKGNKSPRVEMLTMEHKIQNTTQTNSREPSKPPPKKQTLKQKTMAMLDEELRLKMEGISGEGGESGVEYEDGKPVAMKRSVKENMFRYI